MSATFTAAMVQMRTGLLPGPSLEQGIKLIREAAAQGAHYVQTPEVSNMMQVNRKALFELLASEEDDKSLKAYRALAAELKIHLHIGSLALRFSPERAVNRSFLIAPDGNLLASYDKIHMFDIDLPGGESYRESANYQPGETAVISDLPWGRKRRVVPHGAVGLHPEDRRSALAHPAARPRHRDRLLRVRRRAMRHAREQARDLWTLADRCTLG
jgi:predicted amidohydrolase